MNLRTRGIVLSVLPLAITVLLAIPAAIIQVDASQSVARASRTDLLSKLARDVEEDALDVGSTMRGIVHGDPGAGAGYELSLQRLRTNIGELRAAARGPVSNAYFHRISDSLDAYLHLNAGAVAAERRGDKRGALAIVGSRDFSDATLLLRNEASAFDDRAHDAEILALNALNRQWQSSLLLLAVAVAGLALVTMLLLRSSGRIVRSILDLVRKTKRYRGGEPLGPPSPQRDEVGLLDATLHEFVAGQELRERQLQRYRLLAEVTHDIILFIDRTDLTVVGANAAALATYGYERSELIGKPSATLHAVDDPIDAEAIARSDTDAGLSYEGMHQRSDGTVFPVEVHARTAEVEGQLTIIKTIRDISERRRAAEQVSLALDHAVEAARLKSEFVATMSHEIRTPMHGVIGMSELLLATPLSPHQREIATTVSESAQALLAIVDDILDFSKLEANKIELESVAFDPAQLVAGAVNLARATARDKGLALRSYASTHVPSAVRGDPTRLRQILINLIGNAVKFTPTGEVNVSISVNREGTRSVDLLFAVSDTGIGVAPEARERLFDAFVQGDGSTTRRFGGTGLGLSISRRLAELMGGDIWLGEHEGPGSTFCFSARFERTEEAVAAVTLPPDALRVLVLDGDEATRRTLEVTLASWGMRGAAAADIDAAREQLREAARNAAPFDVVLIDYVLPRSDGLAFAAELGLESEYMKPARILISAFDAVGRKEAALAAGCSAYIAKPVDPSDLYDALNEIERSRKAQGAAPDAAPQPARILLAEDSALIRRVARFQLEDLAYGVDIVENGELAVAAVATGQYELVLMDMRMPEMDGLAATRAIRAAEHESGRHVVIIALTANVLEDDREACTEAGMDDFLAKPMNLEALRAVLERWLPDRV